MPAVFIDHDAVLAVARLRIGGGEISQPEAAEEMVRVRLEHIARFLLGAVAVVPGTIREIHRPHLFEGRPGLRTQCFIAGVPDCQAGMIPSLADPFRIFRRQLADRQFLGHVAAEPDRELVVDEDAHLVGDVVPGLRREADAIAQAIPVHVLDALVQQPDPILIPRQLAALAVLEEAVERDVAAAHEIRFAVEHRPARRRIELELPHPEPRPERVRPAAGFQRIEERVFGRPEPAVRQGDSDVERCRAPARSSSLLVKCPATFPDFASRTTNVTAALAGTPSLHTTACTRTDFAATSGAACTERKCGVPDRISSTESKMPRDVPLLLEIEAVGISPPHGVPIRADPDQDFVAAGLQRGLASKYPGVKLGGHDPGPARTLRGLGKIGGLASRIFGTPSSECFVLQLTRRTSDGEYRADGCAGSRAAFQTVGGSAVAGEPAASAG